MGTCDNCKKEKNTWPALLIDRKGKPQEVEWCWECIADSAQVRLVWWIKEV